MKKRNSYRRKVVVTSLVTCLASLVALFPGSSSLAAEAPFLEAVQTILDGEGGTEGLDGVGVVVVAQEGRDVYTAAEADDALIHWRRAEDGTLSVGKIYRGGFEGLEGLDEVYVLLLSDDGLNLYALGREKALLVFRRSVETGELEWAQTILPDPSVLMDLLALARDSRMILSPDGAFLYLVSSGGNSLLQGLAVFSRGPADGRLTRAWEYVEPQLPGGGPAGLRFALSLDLSPDGRHLYVAVALGVLLFAVDPGTGELTPVEIFEGDFGLYLVGAVEVSADGAHIFASNLGGEFEDQRAILVFNRDVVTGRLTKAAECCEGIAGEFVDYYSSYPALAGNGRDLYATGVQEGQLTHLLWDPVTPSLTVIGSYQDDPQGSPGYFGAADVRLSPDGRNLYLASFYDDAAHVFARNAGTGALEPLQSLRDGEGAQPSAARLLQDAAFRPDGRFLYTAGEFDGILGRYEVDSEAGTLRLLDAPQPTIPSHPDAQVSPYRLLFSPDGQFLFLLSRPTAVFRVDRATGDLTFVEEIDLPREFSVRTWALSSDGRDLYMAGSRGFATYSVDTASGHVELLETLMEVDLGDGDILYLNVSDLATSKDGRFLYVFDVNGLLVFERQQDAGGLLVLKYRLTEGVPGVFSFVQFRNLEVSQDGRNLYALQRDISSRVLVFHLNPETGDLTFLEAHPVLASGEEDSIATKSLKLSADGYHLFLADQQTEALVTFVRNPRTGRLTRLEERRNGAGLDGFLNPGVVAVSPDSRIITVSTDAGLQVFRKSDIPCPDIADGLCLNDQRFAVDVEWERPSGATGIGHSVPFGSDDSGLLWFFAEDNWEMLLKVLDGCAHNSQYWVFSAATTNVEYTLNVADRLTGLRRSYTNPQGTSAAALTDTAAFAACPRPSASSGSSTSPVAVPSIFPLPEPRNMTRAQGRTLAGGCVGDEASLCLNQSRFKVEVVWSRPNGTTGIGHAIPFGSDDSGLLWFFNDANWEMLVKILDGCTNNGHYWVFSAATTNVEYTLRVTDTATGVIKEYFNPQGNSVGAITDTGAFETCG